jgi:ABC-type lipoprotein release transport system permease subunit
VRPRRREVVANSPRCPHERIHLRLRLGKARKPRISIIGVIIGIGIGIGIVIATTIRGVFRSLLILVLIVLLVDTVPGSE